MKKILILTGALLSLMISPVFADTWTLSGDNSRLAFGSVKKDTVGEVHSFGGLSGTIGADGTATVEIDVASVQTNIDIRNERMVEHVFKNVATATVTAEIDMSEFEGLEVGAGTDTYADVTLSLLGTELDVEAELYVTRLSETQVMVTTNDMIMLSTADAGIDAGVDKLMELAKLPGITRVAPVTFRLIFNQDDQKAEAAPAASAAELTLVGDAKAGRKVFAKCKACHQLKEGRNAAGPTLYKVFGATAGKVEGFKYSEEMIASGIVWTPETMAAFVANPADYIPGTKMKFPGLKDETDIANLIAYLADKSEG